MVALEGEEERTAGRPRRGSWGGERGHGETATLDEVEAIAGRRRLTRRRGSR